MWNTGPRVLLLLLVCGAVCGAGARVLVSACCWRGWGGGGRGWSGVGWRRYSLRLLQNCCYWLLTNCVGPRNARAPLGGLLYALQQREESRRSSRARAG